MWIILNLAEGTGFEPVRGFPQLVFKTSAINRSANPPFRVDPRGIEPLFPGCKPGALPLSYGPQIKIFLQVNFGGLFLK